MNTLARWLRHLWLDAADARRTLGAEGLRRLEQAVKDSEARHLGELRLCVEAGLPASALWQGQDSRQRALEVFSHLRVWDTAHNNGVLIYLLLADRRIEIVADRGLHDKVGAEAWANMAEQLSLRLRSGQLEAGLLQAVQGVSELLKAHFPAPAQGRQANELPDAVVVL